MKEEKDGMSGFAFIGMMIAITIIVVIGVTFIWMQESEIDNAIEKANNDLDEMIDDGTVSSDFIEGYRLALKKVDYYFFQPTNVTGAALIGGK